MMGDDIGIIIEKARELSESIGRHEITRRYHEAKDRMSKDRSSQELYSRLVAMGKELSFLISREESFETKETGEREFLRNELEQNPLVKEYIHAQREYLELLKRVIDKIRNPS
jgi:cell fate (sporulation/competence/biofilm development) regulator YlbF (YheA/YmcA/DUF963 family)